MYPQAITATVSWGTSNFLFGLLDSKDFPTSCLQFTGYLIVCLTYKAMEHKSGNMSVQDLFFRNFYTKGKLNVVNFVHLVLRALNFFLLSLLIIYASAYAQLAHINFGIIVCCLSISSPFNCICGFLFWGEKLTAKTIIGTAVIVIGVAWVALSKGD